MTRTAMSVGGKGDMNKKTYDPNSDGVISVPQVVGDMPRSTYDADEDGKIGPDALNGRDGAVETVAVSEIQLDIDVVLVSTLAATYVNSGTPYTIILADMDDKYNHGKVKLKGQIRSVHVEKTAYLGYNINGGADILVGNTNSTTYVGVELANVEIAVGDVIQFRQKNQTVDFNTYTEDREVKHTHVIGKPNIFDY